MTVWQLIAPGFYNHETKPYSIIDNKLVDSRTQREVLDITDLTDAPFAIPDLPVPPIQIWTLQDQKSNGTGGGTATTGSWFTRNLNTTVGVNSIDGASLASNEFTLPAGTYQVYGSVPGFLVSYFQTRIYNITDSSLLLNGQNAYVDPMYEVMFYSIIFGQFTLASEKVCALQMKVARTQAINGLGNAPSLSTFEVYSTLSLWKIS